MGIIRLSIDTYQELLSMLPSMILVLVSKPLEGELVDSPIPPNGAESLNSGQDVRARKRNGPCFRESGRARRCGERERAQALAEAHRGCMHVPSGIFKFPHEREGMDDARHLPHTFFVLYWLELPLRIWDISRVTLKIARNRRDQYGGHGVYTLPLPQAEAWARLCLAAECGILGLDICYCGILEEYYGNAVACL